jgi:hypothetical protein
MFNFAHTCRLRLFAPIHPAECSEKEALTALCLDDLIVQYHIEQRLVNLDSGVVFNKAELTKAVHEKLTRDRVVPIISARVSYVIDGISVFGSPGLPN